MQKGDPTPKDRRIIAAMIGAAVVIVLVLLSFALLSDFPGPPPAGENPNKSDAPPEDVRRVGP
jgi:hypothetical protein